MARIAIAKTMNLPAHTIYQPRQPHWISFTEPAWIRLEASNANLGNYTIKDRRFDQAIVPFLQGDWAGIEFQAKASDIVYSGADHHGTPLSPNITVLPDLPVRTIPGELDATGKGAVLGCTMGHWHLREERGQRIQEIYEFQSYGLMVLDHENGEVEIWVLRQGDKVAVSSGCHMTIYNLGGQDQPLVTLDFANPAHNPANKELIGALGPILLAYRTPTEVVFAVNRLYLNAANTKAGVRLQLTDKDPRQRQIRIALHPKRVIGKQLHEKLTSDPDIIRQFSLLGLQLKRAVARTRLTTPAGATTTLSQPLVDSVAPGTAGYRFFLG